MQRLSHTSQPVRALPALALLVVWMLQVFALPFHLAIEDHNPQQHGHAHVGDHGHSQERGCKEEPPHAPHSELEHRIDVLPQRSQVEMDSVFAWRVPESPIEWMQLPRREGKTREIWEPRLGADRQRRPHAQRGPPEFVA